MLVEKKRIVSICYEIHWINKYDIKARESIHSRRKKDEKEKRESEKYEIQSTIDYENRICFIRWIENDFNGSNVQTESFGGKRKMMKTHDTWNSM